MREEIGMRAFAMYRRGDLSATHDSNQANAPDEPQFEGVVFSDGSVAVRWLTAKRSTSVWASLDDLLAIHGHPEYDSELRWGLTADSQEKSTDERFEKMSDEAEFERLRVIERTAREFADSFALVWAGSMDPKLCLDTSASQAFLRLMTALGENPRTAADSQEKRSE